MDPRIAITASIESARFSGGAGDTGVDVFTDPLPRSVAIPPTARSGFRDDRFSNAAGVSQFTEFTNQSIPKMLIFRAGLVGSALFLPLPTDRNCAFCV